MLSNKERRKERKQKKLLAEYELAKSNDQLKRPGQFLDSEFARRLEAETSSGSGALKMADNDTQFDRQGHQIPTSEMNLIKKQLEDHKQKIREFELAKKRKFIFEGIEGASELAKPRKKHKLETKESETNGNKVLPCIETRRQLSPEEFQLMKQQLKERKNYLTSLPRFLLQSAGLTASLSQDAANRVPILMCDVQHLLLYALCGNNGINQPQRWCLLQKHNQLTHIVVLIVEGLTTPDFILNEHLFPKLTNHFPDRVEMLAPSHYGCDVAQELASVPMSGTLKDKLIRKYGTLEDAVGAKEIFQVFRAVFPIQIPTVDGNSKKSKFPVGDVFSRVDLMLGLSRMISENFPLKLANQIADKYAEFKLTKTKYNEVSSHSPLFAIDCEMCMTNVRSELTRISVVNEKLEVVYESLVKPLNPIVNYLTRFSGITKEMLEDVTTTLEDVQKSIQEILPEDAILIGHSLNCDLEAMQMIHPYVIDTSCIFNMTGQFGRKSKLANLSEYFLKENIQQEKTGHCPTEDAKAAMKLVKLKLSKGYYFGDYSMSQTPAEKISKTAQQKTEVKTPELQLTSSIFSHTRKASKTVALIAPESTLETYKNYSIGEKNPAVFVQVPDDDHKSIISYLKDSAVNHNFALAHLNMFKKIEKAKKSSNPRKLEKLYSKIDNWCDEVYSHVSLNGLCVVLFSGPNLKAKSLSEQKYQSDDSNSFLSNNNSTRNDSSNKGLHDSSAESSQLEIKAVIDTNPRQNGVCFIKINSPRV